MEVVADCRKLFEERTTFAPYFALIQSSGSGKTTLMHLLMKQYPNSWYINFSKSTYFHTLPTEGKKHQSTDFKQAITSSCKLTNEEEAITSIHNELLQYFPTDTVSNSCIRILCIDEARELCNMKAKYKNEDRTAFELFRKAISQFNAKIVVILADTVSVIGNFVPPPYKYTPHLRSADLNPTDLFRAMYYIPFVNAQR